MYEIKDSYYPISPYSVYTSSNILIMLGMMTMLFSFYLSIAKIEIQYVIVGTFYGVILCCIGCVVQLYYYFCRDKSQDEEDIDE